MAKVIRFEDLRKIRFNQLGERQIMTGHNAMFVKTPCIRAFLLFRTSTRMSRS